MRWGWRKTGPIAVLSSTGETGWFNLAALISAHIKDLLALGISLALEIGLVVLLVRRRAGSHFPLFFFYALLAAAATAARLLVIFHYSTYFYVYWWTEGILLPASLVALHEVFYWVFEGFHRVWWFRAFYYGVIAAVLGIGIRNAIVSPPVQAHPVISLILDTSMAVNLLRMGIVSLYFLLKKLLTIEDRRYADGIVIGFGLSSAGPLLGFLARSEFGTRMEKVAIYAAAVAYTLGAAAWVITFMAAERKEKEWLPPMSPERMLEEVQGYLKALGIKNR